VIAHLRRHRFREHLLQRGHGLSRAVAGRSTGDDLRGTIQVVTHGELRTRKRFKSDQGGERYHVPRAIPNVELPDILSTIAIGPFRLDVDLPLPTEAIEVVHERAPHECLDRAIDIADLDPL